MIDIHFVSLIILVVICVLAGLIVGWFATQRIGKTKLLNAEHMAQRIIDEAQREAEAQKKSALLETREEWYNNKLKFEKETEATREELHQFEARLAKKELNLDRKVDILNKKERDVEKRIRELQSKERIVRVKDERLSRLIEEQNQKLEKIAGMTASEAKEMLMKNLESEARLKASGLIKEIRDRAVQMADREAKKIITLAVQRCATDHVAESTVSVVTLPSDEMKGRIIGREGRNIRSFETATGIDVIIDDTPEAVILSGFDPIRREVARLSLERLITDGRIHPARIEEVVNKATKDVQESIKQAGEETAMSLAIHGLHPELVNIIGRLKFRTSYGQNCLQHSMEVATIAKLIASEMDIDHQLAVRGGLLHDIGKAVDHEAEGTHTQIGVELARKYGEPEEVVNAIAAHHEDVEPETLTAIIVQAADAISGARPGARRETLETYIKRLEKLEEIADSFRGVAKSYAIQAGREVRIIVEHEEISDPAAQELAVEIARKVEQQLEYPGQIKVTVIREMRAVEYAK
ncbi:ribonuclease Y [candidate division KSB1 bacterium]